MQKRTITDLSRELIDEVLQGSSKATCSALCRVSKSLNLLATCSLYRDLWLESAPQIIKICKVIISNPLAAGSVRAFMIVAPEAQVFDVSDMLGPPKDTVYLSSFYHFVNKALERIPGVLKMSLDYPYDAGFDLRRCNYPNLQIFGTTQPLTVSVAEFLNRHPTITRLTLATPPWDGSTGLPKICLPRLNEVSMVPSSLIPNLSFNCHVESIRLFWICTEDVCDAHFKAIAQSRSPVLRVSITFAAWQPAVITALFRHIAPSRVHGLMMSHIGRPSAPSEEEFLHTLGVALKESRPPNLSQLMCQCLKYGVVNVATYDRDFAFMREWGEILPGLAGCILPAGVTWFRLRGPAWIPDMSLPLSKRWLFKMLRERQYPFVELITPLLRVYRKSQGTYDPLGIKNLRVIKPDSALFLENAFDPDELADDEEYLYQEGDELDDDGDPKIRALMEQDGVHLEDFYRYED